MSTTRSRSITRRSVRRILGVAAVALVGVGAYLFWFHQGRKAVPTVDASRLSGAIASHIEAAREQVSEDPSSAGAWGEYGTVLLAFEFVPEAIYCFRQARRLDPSGPRWPYLQAIATMALPHPDNSEAIRLLQESLASDDGESTDVIRVRLARLQLEKGDVEAARQTLRPLIARRPNHPLGCLLMGQIAHESGDAESAVGYLKRCRDSVYTRRAAAFLLAGVYQSLDRDLAASDASERAAELPEDQPWPDPFLDEVHSLRRFARSDGRQGNERASSRQQQIMAARRLRDQGRFREAIDAYRALLKDAKQDANLCFEMAQVLAAVRQYDEAMRFSRMCLNIEPAYSDAYALLAHCLEQTGKSKASLDQWRKAVMYAPLDPKARTRYAQALYRAGQPQRAMRVLELAERLGQLPRDGANLLNTLRLPHTLAAQIGAGTPGPLTALTFLRLLPSR